jgi:hypothetical protein
MTLLSVGAILKRCAYLTDEHAQALLNFTEKRFIRNEGTLVCVFKRQPSKETTANPLAIDVIFESDGKVIESRNITTPELMLLADSLLKKDPS